MTSGFWQKEERADEYCIASIVYMQAQEAKADSKNFGNVDVDFDLASGTHD
jgi:hypothetical protein